MKIFSVCIKTVVSRKYKKADGISEQQKMKHKMVTMPFTVCVRYINLKTCSGKPILTLGLMNQPPPKG